MLQFRNQLVVLALLLFGPSSANAWFSFNNLLYAMRLCHHESSWCPKPRCFGPGHHPEICDYYRCQSSSEGGPAGRECVFVGHCDGDEACIESAMYLGVDADYYDETDYTDSYSYSPNIGDGSAFTGSNTSSSSTWLPYAIMGALLVGLVAAVIWRKRAHDPKGELGEELGPGEEDLTGAVARHHGNINSMNSRQTSRTTFINTHNDYELA